VCWAVCASLLFVLFSFLNVEHSTLTRRTVGLENEEHIVRIIQVGYLFF
jgi:hypothetical protein